MSLCDINQSGIIAFWILIGIIIGYVLKMIDDVRGKFEDV
jgi:hypothetical protein